MTNIRKLGSTFDRTATLYHAIRPAYPHQLFDSLHRVAALHAGAQVLEIGPGTGQATRSLAMRNYHITAIEMGSELAALAREQLRHFPNVRVVTGAFEEVDLPARSFDLIFAATSFHWIKRGYAFSKSAHLLRENGYLAIVHTHHITDGAGDDFYYASQPIYQKYFPRSTNTKTRLLARQEISPWKLDAKLFHLSHFETFPLRIDYSGSEYADLLATYSPTQRLAQPKRENFLAEITRLIETKFDNLLEKHFAISLTIAAKNP